MMQSNRRSLSARQTAADNRSLSAYVEDLRSINSLRRDAPLQVGQSLLIVYYADAAN